MSKANAQQIVNKLLEYGIDPDAPRPGSPEDPWRQSLGHVQPMSFAPRPGSIMPPEQDVLNPEDLMDAPPEPEAAGPMEDPEEERHLRDFITGKVDLLPKPPAAKPPGPGGAPPMGRPGQPARFQWKPPQAPPEV